MNKSVKRREELEKIFGKRAVELIEEIIAEKIEEVLDWHREAYH